jgi:hypothetical protein
VASSNSSCEEEMKSLKLFRELKTIGQLTGSNAEARPSVQYVQYRVLRNGFETLTSMCVREGSSGVCTHKIAMGDSDLTKSALALFASDITRGQRNARNGHSGSFSTQSRRGKWERIRHMRSLSFWSAIFY